ncbi:hypothetical protein [Pseudomonas sp. NFIX28]|uniref:hypothetical protein n=1 Tax=Pseudomonas sp. NFIX28 TaxID=1566235 RepID=UPI00089D77FE|nr:hypothetical protein [Pseudomonas sp. NFIX28]SDY38002.1 hypothetical protein SAMN03159453_00425 [Pseudomonas sp. NFIX28]
MNDWVVIQGDIVKFDPVFGNRTVIPPPTTINGTGKATINNKNVCVKGDERQVRLMNVPYTTASHTVPGTGTITIVALDASQEAKKSICGQPIIIKGQKFKAQFLPTQPAMTPPPASSPDLSVPSMGTGSFNISQRTVKAG